MDFEVCVHIPPVDAMAMNLFSWGNLLSSRGWSRDVPYLSLYHKSIDVLFAKFNLKKKGKNLTKGRILGSQFQFVFFTAVHVFYIR